MASSKSPPSTSSPAENPVNDAAPSPRDVALVHQVSSDGTVHVIRRRGEQLEAGALRPLREGTAIQGEVVSLRPRENFPLLCDVDVLYSPPAEAPKSDVRAAPSPPRRKGPAQVATSQYRDNWDSIWARKKSDSLN
jgi:hypothetical protein